MKFSRHFFALLTLFLGARHARAQYHPSANPTLAPTNPTLSPTASPTQPSPAPTEKPTQPSPAPSPAPTNPTWSPTVAPTSYTPDKFIKQVIASDATTWKRQNFCQIMHAVATKQVTLANSLKGQLVVIGVEPPGQVDAAFISYDATSGYPNAGYLYDLHQELARLGGFTIEYRSLPPRGPSDTLSNYFKTNVALVDMLGGRLHTDSPANRKLGMTFTAAIGDLSLVLVTPSFPTPVDATWSFAAPFTISLWSYIFMILFFNGLVFAIFGENIRGGVTAVTTSESVASRRARQKGPYAYVMYVYENFAELTEAIYFSLGRFVGAGGMQPKTIPMQFAYTAFCFFILVVLAYYTANLATFLIAVKTTSTAIHSIDEANALGSKVCSVAGSAGATALTNEYKNILQIPQTNYAALGLSTGQCVAAIIAEADFSVAQTRTSMDVGCDLQAVGGIIKKYSGAMIVKTDWNDKCSSLMNQVMSTLLLQLAASNFLVTSLQANLVRNTDLVCPDPEPAALSLGPNDVSGIFFLYAYSLGLALALHVFYAHGIHFISAHTVKEKTKVPTETAREEERDLELSQGFDPIPSSTNEPGSPDRHVDDFNQFPGLSENTGSPSSDRMGSVESDATNQVETPVKNDAASSTKDAASPLKDAASPLKGDGDSAQSVTVQPSRYVSPLTLIDPFYYMSASLPSLESGLFVPPPQGSLR